MDVAQSIRGGSSPPPSPPRINSSVGISRDGNSVRVGESVDDSSGSGKVAPATGGGAWTAPVQKRLGGTCAASPPGFSRVQKTNFTTLLATRGCLIMQLLCRE